MPEREARDAFGFSVEGEAIGLYDIDEVRGASPLEAGNVRIEGLYAVIDEPTDRLSDEAAIAVGSTTLETRHPAPSGVVNFALREPETDHLSIAWSLADRWSMEASVDVGWHINRSFSLAAGVGGSVLRRDNFGDPDYDFEIASALHWRDGGHRLSAFIGGERDWDQESPIVYVSDAGLPPFEISRRRSFHQAFVNNHESTWLAGLIAELAITAQSRLRAGAFISRDSAGESLFENFRLDNGGDDGFREINAIAPTEREAVSGELRLEHALDLTGAEIVLFAGVRARSEHEQLGGIAEGVLDVTPVPITLRRQEVRPALDFGPDQIERVSQQLAGGGALINIGDRFELSLGLEHSWYEQSLRIVDGVVVSEGVDRRWIGNFGVALQLTNNIRIYGGYATGLEELGSPPVTAVNANSALAASSATQYDAAVIWRPHAALEFVAGAFDIRRPFADSDDADVYRVLGEEHTRGIELSAIWRPNEDANLLAGMIVQEPRLRGNELGNAYTPGRPTETLLVSADFAAPLIDGLFLNVAARHQGGAYLDEDSDARLPAHTQIDLALRYEFDVRDTPVEVELGLSNAMDAFQWVVESGGEFTLNEPRTLRLSISADF